MRKEKREMNKEQSNLRFRAKSKNIFLWINQYFGFILIPAIAIIILIILIFIFSDNPFSTLYFFFIGPFRSVFSFGNMLNASVPLILGALGVSIAMKTGNLNLGGEGQVYLGAFITVAAALELSNTFLSQYGIIIIIIACLLGTLCSGSIAALSGFCKAKWNTNELITTFLLSCAVIPVINYLITGPYLNPETSLISTKKIAENLRLALLLKPSNLNIGIFIAIFFVFIVHIFLSKTKLGYEFRMAGKNEIFARYGGINTKLNTVMAMLFSGILYGLAGSIAVLGTHHAVIKEFSSGLGWNALAVALIARFYSPAVIPAAFFFAWLGAGSRIAMQNTGLTMDVALIVQAVILFLCTSTVLLKAFLKTGKHDG